LDFLVANIRGSVVLRKVLKVLKMKEEALKRVTLDGTGEPALALGSSAWNRVDS
jgi:hypothetical protein